MDWWCEGRNSESIIADEQNAKLLLGSKKLNPSSSEVVVHVEAMLPVMTKSHVSLFLLPVNIDEFGFRLIGRSSLSQGKVLLLATLKVSELYLGQAAFEILHLATRISLDLGIGKGIVRLIHFFVVSQLDHKKPNIVGEVFTVARRHELPEIVRIDRQQQLSVAFRFFSEVVEVLQGVELCTGLLLHFCGRGERQNLGHTGDLDLFNATKTTQRLDHGVKSCSDDVAKLVQTVAFFILRAVGDSDLELLQAMFVHQE